MQRIRAHLPAAIKRNFHWAWLSLIALLGGLASAAPAHAATLSTGTTPDLHTSRDGIFTRAVRTVLAARHQTSDRALALHKVRAGESISSVAARACGHAGDWTGIYRASRAHHMTARNANVLTVGQLLVIDCAYAPAELKFASPPRQVHATLAVVHAHRIGHGGKIWGVTYGYPYFCGDGDGDGYDMPCSKLHRHASTRRYQVHTVYRGRSYRRSYSNATSYRGSGGCQSHIIRDESGGNARAVNPSSGAGGLYQFLPSTWHALGHSGLPQDASVAEQTQAYHQQVSQSGYSAWAASGGC